MLLGHSSSTGWWSHLSRTLVLGELDNNFSCAETPDCLRAYHLVRYDGGARTL